MTSILGQNINLIRPRNIKPVGVRKSDRPVAKYNTKPKTNKDQSGKVLAVVIELINNNLFGLYQGTHMQVCEFHDISPHYVKRTGWVLENGTYLWR